MKILHVAPDLEAARVPSRAIHAIADSVTLARAGTPADALEWLREHTDTAAVILEVEAQSCAPFVEAIRAARVQTPVVVVAGSARLDAAIDALNSGADGCLLAGHALERDLPGVVGRTIDRVGDRIRERSELAADLAEQRRRLARENGLCTALQQQSLQLEGALARMEMRRATEAAAFADLLDARLRTFTEHLDTVSESHAALGTELAAATAALEGEREARADLESRHSAALEAHAAAVEEHAAACASYERSLAEAVDAQRQSERRANRILAAALAREEELTGELETESAAKAIAESEAASARMAAARRRDRSLLVASRYRRRVRLDRDSLRQQIDRLEGVAGAHAAARARLEELVSERDRQLTDETRRHLAAEQDAQRYVARLQGRLRHEVEEHQADVAQLQHELALVRRELEAARADAELLRGVADRVPDLERRLDRTHREKRRQFERAPFGLCRCSGDGTVIEANHSFVALLGYRRAEDLRNLSWLTVAKERTGDLGWLLERAQATRKAESVETLWHTREGRRIIVRLQALAASAGEIDIIAEDITTVRVLEERIRQAQKMEAVGRLASEVAVTCETLLGQVARETESWADRAPSSGLRMSADRMREEVTKARELLHRLGSYGDEQKRALEPVSAQRVLRELAPVMKRLVGERIELVLPKTSGAFPVDVDAERLERVLTNVAGYARQRMPMGGQVTLELATIAIGRRFAAGHSNVRAGDHVLITVTEVPSDRAGLGDVPPAASATDAAGMELGVLMELISSCGGHLWLEAQPAGNMMLKIHLPKPGVQADGGAARRLPRWLRAAAAVNLLA
jgi:PAS domain-containing protein